MPPFQEFQHASTSIVDWLRFLHFGCRVARSFSTAIAFCRREELRTSRSHLTWFEAGPMPEGASYDSPRRLARWEAGFSTVWVEGFGRCLRVREGAASLDEVVPDSARAEGEQERQRQPGRTDYVEHRCAHCFSLS
jgi:hypothetical protein